MGIKSTSDGYGRVAVVFHWLSALLILGMFPLGFLLDDLGGSVLAYRAHAFIGIAVLGLTVLRVAWTIFDVTPNPPDGLEGAHLKGLKAVHILLYATLVILAGSGIALNLQSGLVEVIQGTSSTVPEFEGFISRDVHHALAKVYLALLGAHIGGVALHHIKHGGLLARMGIGAPKKS